MPVRQDLHLHRNTEHEEDRQPLLSDVHVGVAPRISPRFFATHKGSLRGFAQFSNSMYCVYNNVTMCIKFLLQISNMVDSFYKGLVLNFWLIAVLYMMYKILPE